MSLITIVQPNKTFSLFDLRDCEKMEHNIMYTYLSTRFTNSRKMKNRPEIIKLNEIIYLTIQPHNIKGNGFTKVIQ